MATNRSNWLWEKLRGRKRKDLDRLEADLLRRPAERRPFAGDPNQPRPFWVRTRNR